MTEKVMSANRLADGRVVYLDSRGDWCELIDDSRVSASEQDEAEMTALAAASVEAEHIVDPYLIDIARENGTIRPTRFREYIRAMGPTIRTDLGKQAEGTQRHV